MKKSGNKFISPVKLTVFSVLVLGLAGSVGFGLLYYRLNIDWALGAAITFFMFAYHMIIRLLAPVIVFAFTRKKYDCNARRFRQKSFEPALYRALRVKKWKGNVPAYNPDDFSLKNHSLEEIVNNTCHAETVHELIVILSFTSLFFAIPFGDFAVFLITAVLAAAVDCVFVIIQRYNRPRLIKIINMKNK